MKRLVLILCAALACLGAALAAGGGPTISFGDKKYDFGTIKEADGKVSHEFEFTNTGDAPLIIKAAYGSCSCTVPEYPEAPIAPGRKGVIKVIYDPAHKRGEVNATVTVVTNDKKHKRAKVMVRGVVVPKND